MRIEPETEIDKAIAAAWPQRWEQANAEVKGTRTGWSSNAKRRNRLRREWSQHCYEQRQR